MMNNISGFNECANCGACINSCPTDAIVLNKESLFYQFSVDENKCISCGKCKNVCPVNNLQNKQNLISAYGGFSYDNEIVKKSSSGGAFSTIADLVISNDGIVFGSAFSSDYYEVLVKSTDEVDIDELRRSKYVESNPILSYRKIKNELISGRQVLFCGTPCQVAGLKSYLEKDYENLLTCDFACGGLPSHLIYSEYVKALEKKYNSVITSVNFRPKVDGWLTHSIKMDFGNRKKYVKQALLDPYFYSFVYARTSIRDNCNKCSFKNNHYSDIVLADFWKYASVSDIHNDNTGISLILTNSIKGEKIIDEIKGKMNLVQLDLKEASYNCEQKKVDFEAINKKRNKYFSNYEEKGLQYAAEQAGMLHGKDAGIYLLKKYIRKVIK